MTDRTRELGTIVSAEIVDTDHGWLSVYVTIDLDNGGSQSFGGLTLQRIDYQSVEPEKDDTLIKDYNKDLCESFDVSSLKELVGKKCYALRPTDKWNEYIVGIESVDTGKRFTNFGWRKKHFPDIKDPYAERLAYLESDRAQHERRARELHEEIMNLQQNFKIW